MERPWDFTKVRLRQSFWIRFSCAFGHDRENAQADLPFKTANAPDMSRTLNYIWESKALPIFPKEVCLPFEPFRQEKPAP